jgi:hypothetical protein
MSKVLKIDIYTHDFVFLDWIFALAEDDGGYPPEVFFFGSWFFNVHENIYQQEQPSATDSPVEQPLDKLSNTADHPTMRDRFGGERLDCVPLNEPGNQGVNPSQTLS